MAEDERIDKPLVELIQARFPLVREPYAQLAGEIGCSEGEFLARLADLRRPEGIVREISAIFDAAALGYEQTLVAFCQHPSDLDQAGRIVAGHPGVSHCYGRDGRYNLWFTLAVSPQSRLALARTVEALAELTGAEARLLLAATKRYKLRFVPKSLHNNGLLDEPAPDRPQATPAPHLSDEQIRAVAALQEDLPNRQDPFAAPAGEAKLDPDMLLVHAADLLAGGYMRRYSAVLRHRQAGEHANVMVAWRVDRQAADPAGTTAAAFPAVSHCYLRETCKGWPYNLYAMIHGRSRADCRQTIDQIAAATGLSDRQELWTLREYKKQRVRFFTEDELRWERELDGDH